MLSPARISVIISTFDAPGPLELALLGYSLQTVTGFEVVIADDGSGPATAALVEGMRPRFPGGVRHVWHEHDGFRKSRILNLAILASRNPYLIFTDGDCVPREDFVAVHAANARAHRFLSGGCVRLPTGPSEALDAEDVRTGRVFDPRALRVRGFRDLHGLAKLASMRSLARLMDAVTPTKRSWNGHNASGWKSDILSANGFDERMEYGGQDRELGERLANAGVRGVQIRHRAVTLHLDHPRSYRSEAAIARNREIRAATRSRHATWTDFGVVRGPRVEDPRTVHEGS